MTSSSKQQLVAMELGFDKAVAEAAITTQDFANTGDMIEYPYLHEEELEKEVKEKEESDDQAAMQALHEETENLRRSKYCHMCEKEESSTVLLPCCHFCLCSNCVKACQYCPFPKCNMLIHNVIQTFLV